VSGARFLCEVEVGAGGPPVRGGSWWFCGGDAAEIWLEALLELTLPVAGGGRGGVAVRC